MHLNPDSTRQTPITGAGLSKGGVGLKVCGLSYGTQKSTMETPAEHEMSSFGFVICGLGRMVLVLGPNNRRGKCGG